MKIWIKRVSWYFFRLREPENECCGAACIVALRTSLAETRHVYTSWCNPSTLPIFPQDILAKDSIVALTFEHIPWINVVNSLGSQWLFKRDVFGPDFWATGEISANGMGYVTSHCILIHDKDPKNEFNIAETVCDE